MIPPLHRQFSIGWERVRAGKGDEPARVLHVSGTLEVQRRVMRRPVSWVPENRRSRARCSS
jgi:hypothetical protein